MIHGCLSLKLVMAAMFSVLVAAGRSSAAGLADLQSLQQNAERSYKERAELLLHSHGNAVMEWKTTAGARVARDGSAPPPFKPKVGVWTTQWWSSGEKYRYDVESGQPVPGMEESWAFRAPYNIRLAADKESSLYYFPINNKAYCGDAIKRMGNPWGLHRSFQIEYCYDAGLSPLGYLDLLSEMVANYKGDNVKITEETIHDLPCQKVTYTKRWPNEGRRLDEIVMWLNPATGYSLVKMTRSTNALSIAFKEPELKMELSQSYEAAYEQKQGVFLLKWVKMAMFDPIQGGEDLTITFDETEIGVDVPDATFTFDGLGVPQGAKVTDRRLNRKAPTISYYKEPPKEDTKALAEVIDTATQPVETPKPVPATPMPEKEGNPSPQPSPQRPVWLAVGLGAIVVVALSAMVRFGRRHLKK